MGWMSWIFALLWGLFHLILGLPFTIFDLYLAFAWVNLLFLGYATYRLVRDLRKKNSDPWGFAYIMRIVNTGVAFWLFYLVSPSQMAIGTPLFIIIVIYSLALGYF